MFKQGRVSVPARNPPPPAPAFSRLLEKLPFLLSAASCVVTFRVQQSGGSVLDVNNLPVAARVANALMSYVRYLGKMLVAGTPGGALPEESALACLAGGPGGIGSAGWLQWR